MKMAHITESYTIQQADNISSFHQWRNSSEKTITDLNYYSFWKSVLGIFVIGTLFGNILVVLAVVKVKALRTVTNYLIVSLALADITVGALVMPLAVYVEITNGVFELPARVCDAWVALDVLACTASILNLTAISIDRFLAIIHAIMYTQKLKNSQWYAVTMIAICWIISIAIALPIAVGANDTIHREPHTCSFYNPMFSTLSSMGSFFIPTAIMIVLYWRIFRVIRQRAQAQSQQSKKAKISLNNARGSTCVPITCDQGSDDSAQSPPVEPAEDIIPHSQKFSLLGNGQDVNQDGTAETMPLAKGAQIDNDTQEMNGNSVCQVPGDEPEKNKSDSPAMVNGGSRLIVVENTSPTKQRTLTLPKIPLSPVRRLSMRTTGRSKREKRERRATITLVVVLCVFLSCWIPFFVANNLEAICLQWEVSASFCNTPPALFSFFVWLGYINSTLNPIIYAVMNVTYRKAFAQILGCGK